MVRVGWDKEGLSGGEVGVLQTSGFKSLYMPLIVSRRTVHLLSPGDT